MNLDEALKTFVAESRELLDDMQAALLGARGGDDRRECVHALFRAAHTIKGSAGLFGLDAIVAFTHVAESLLDELRAGDITLDDALLDLLLDCHDHLGALIDALDAGEDAARLAAAGDALAVRLRARMAAAASAALAALPASKNAQAPARRWHLSLRFGPDVLRNGMDPLAFLRYLRTLGRIERIVTLTDALPPLQALEPTACHLGFEIDFDSAADRDEIERVFEFVRDDCALSVTPATPAGAAQPQREPKAHETRSLRVDADKLDRLIDLVGELIIAAAGAKTAARAARNAELAERNDTLAGLVEQVRDSALQLRMVKIGATFARFERVVHDVARELGKDIALLTAGEDTELDKTLVEKIADPLTHLVRNAIDHGIESADARAAAGKPARGSVRLNAYHDSGSIVIEVSDDGRGIDRARVHAKALERGLVEAGRALSDAEVFALLFEPGFSTAQQVTNLSGRGVGMDVVKRNIEALRGSVEIASRAGEGTTVTVRLPLTLAIINGFQLAVGDAVFVVPLEMVDECISCNASAHRDYVDLRGRVLPFVRLRELFHLPGTAARRENIVVVRHGAQRIGLVVDTLLGEAQTVIKPLARMFTQVRGISGSSILGNGDVALILDVPALVNQAAAAASTA